VSESAGGNDQPSIVRDPLRSLNAMIAAAADMEQWQALEDVARALHAHLYEPKTAAARRVAELGFLAEVLRVHPQDPRRLPTVKEEIYDEQRIARAPGAPIAETLARHYGGWKRACYAAYGLRIDGSKSEPGTPWPTALPGKALPSSYTRDECVASVVACAEAIGRIPTSTMYAEWRLNRFARARERGENVRLASPRRILATLAPERGHRDGWKIVRRKVFAESPT
jgi:hypothetical protein